MKNIKKTICVITAMLMLSVCFAFASCNSEKKPDEVNGSTENVSSAEFSNESSQSAKDAPQFVLATQSNEYGAGDEVKIRVRLKNSPLTAGFDFYVVADYAEYVDASTETLSDLQMMSDGTENTFRVMGVIATTKNIDGELLAEITFRLSDSLSSGDTVTFTGSTKEFIKGRTPDGAKIDDITARLSDPVLTVKIK